jgi:formylglycine-generating enzyme required for sulfatase activity
MHSHPVGAKQPNPWGLFDIHGNVWELSYDWNRAGKPVDMSLAKAGPNITDRIIFMGGGYSASPDDALEPPSGPPNIGYSHLGFRVALVDWKELSAEK